MEVERPKPSRFQKVMAWRVCSIILTLCILWMAKGDVGEATSITFVLHFVLIIAHWIFEWLWEERLPNYLNR